MIEVSLKVWGDRALFTRPEFKAEQVSYDIPTPSAAEGLLDSIFWKPEIVYRKLTRIDVLNPIRFSGLMINHVKSVVSRTGNPINIEIDRTQRHALYLKDVAYVFTYRIEVYEIGCFMEENAKTEITNLGRGFSWRKVLDLPEYEQLQLDLFAETRSCTCIE